MKLSNMIILILVVGIVPVVFSQQTSDGGYILGGTSQSYIHGSSGDDFLVYKIDAAGNKQWRKNYGGTLSERCFSVQQTTDGGYILAGYGNSGGSGLRDFLLYKVDAGGSKEWRKSYGGINEDLGYSVQQTTDGGYILAGHSDSFTPGDHDFLVYKIDIAGAKQWRKNYGGINGDFAGWIQQTSDGGYILIGDGDSYTHGNYDALVYKMDASGNVEWRKNYGGSGYEFGRCIRQTPEGGYVFIGQSDSYSGGDYDFILYKLAATGMKQWRRTYGGDSYDYGYGVWLCTDGGYALIGRTRSFTHGSEDFLVYKLDVAGNKQWRKNYGGDNTDMGYIIQQTSDGGYILLGTSYTYTNGSCDFLAYKVDAAGNKLWRKNYGGSKIDHIYSYK